MGAILTWLLVYDYELATYFKPRRQKPSRKNTHISCNVSPVLSTIHIHPIINMQSSFKSLVTLSFLTAGTDVNAYNVLNLTQPPARWPGPTRRQTCVRFPHLTSQLATAPRLSTRKHQNSPLRDSLVLRLQQLQEQMSAKCADQVTIRSQTESNPAHLNPFCPPLADILLFLSSFAVPK